MKTRGNKHPWERPLRWQVSMILSALVLLVFASGPALALDPPEVLVYKHLLNSVGKTPEVSISEPMGVGTHFIINVTVKNSARRSAMATVLAPNNGGSYVLVKVVDSQGNVQKPVAVKGTIPEKLAKIKALFQTAFKSNPLYVMTKTVYIAGIYGVFPIFKAKLVQFECDNMADYYGNENYVAADLFRQVLNPDIGKIYISLSTQQMAARQ